MYTAGELNWKAGHVEIGCTLVYYHRDHPHSVRDHGVNLQVGFVYALPHELGELTPVTEVPLLKRFLIVMSRKAIIVPEMVDLTILADGVEFRPSAQGPAKDGSDYYFGPEPTNEIIDSFKQSKTVEIGYKFEDGVSDTRALNMAAFEVANSMFDACSNAVGEP